MVRLLLSALVTGLFLSAGLVTAQERKEVRKPVMGTYESYRDGVLILKVDGKPVEYRVEPTFKTTVWPETGDPRENVFARESFRELKAGTPVQITYGDGERINTVIVGMPRKRP